MRRRDIRAARKEARQYDWQALLTANDGGDEFDYAQPTVYVEPDSAENYERDAIAGARSDEHSINRRDER